LVFDPLHLPRPAAALADTSVVEGQDTEPCLVKIRGEPVGARFLGDGEPAGHHHAGAVGARVVPGRAQGAGAGESDLAPVEGRDRIGAVILAHD